MSADEKKERHNINVFISYAHESLELADSILKLSDRLRIDGFDCSIDQYEDSPDIGWPRWMEKQIRNSDFVLVVCTKEYLNRLQNFESKTGSGVKWETNLIFQHLYDANSLNTKFIPIIFYEEDVQFIPSPLKGSTYYRLYDDFEYRLLYMRLRGIKYIEKPDLGPLSNIDSLLNKKMISFNLINKEDWDRAGWEGVSFVQFAGIDIPFLGLIFKDEYFGKKIFTDWRARFTREDTKDNIHMSVIKYVDKLEENRYMVIIGTNTEKERQKIADKDQNVSLLVDNRSFDVGNKDFYESWKRFECDFHRNEFFVLCLVVGDTKTGNLVAMPGFEIIKRHINIMTQDEIPNNSVERYIFETSQKRRFSTEL